MESVGKGRKRNPKFSKGWVGFCYAKKRGRLFWQRQMKTVWAKFLREDKAFWVDVVSQVALVVKNLPSNAGDIKRHGLMPGLGRFSGEENGNPLQHSCLENPMDRGAWWAAVHGVTQSWTRLKWLSTRAQLEGHRWRLRRGIGKLVRKVYLDLIIEGLQ